MKRLDSGDSAWGFQVDRGLRRLCYIEGGGLRATKLVVLDLETGRRRKHRFAGRKIERFHISASADAVTIAADKTGQGEYGQSLLRIEPESGRVLQEEDRPSVQDSDLAAFGEPVVKELLEIDDVMATKLAPPPVVSVGDDRVRSTAADSPPPSGPKEEAGETLLTQRVSDPRPGLKIAVKGSVRRVLRFFPTHSKPSVTVFAAGKIYAAYLGKDDAWRLDEFDYENGSVRAVASFRGEIESLAESPPPVVSVGDDRVRSTAAESGGRLMLLRRGSGGNSRRLALVDPGGAGIALDVPWEDGGGKILAVDGARQRLYVQLDEGEVHTAWSVPLAVDSLRAASDFLARSRGSFARQWASPDILLAGGLSLGAIIIFGLVIAFRQGP